jgi:hypothetical protein
MSACIQLHLALDADPSQHQQTLKFPQSQLLMLFPFFLVKQNKSLHQCISNIG